MSDSLWPHGLWLARLPCPWDFPGKNTGMGCHFLLQGIFLTQGSNPGLPHCRQILYQLCHLVRQERIAGKTCYRKLKESDLILRVCAQSCLTLLWPPWKPSPGHRPRLLCPWDFPGKKTGVDSHFLLQISSCKIYSVFSPFSFNFLWLGFFKSVSMRHFDQTD